MTNPITDLAARFEAKREDCEKRAREVWNAELALAWKNQAFAFEEARDMARAGAAGEAGEIPASMLEQAHQHAVDLAQCALFVEAKHLSKAMTDAASFLRQVSLLAPPPPAQQGSAVESGLLSDLEDAAAVLRSNDAPVCADAVDQVRNIIANSGPARQGSLTVSAPAEDLAVIRDAAAAGRFRVRTKELSEANSNAGMVWPIEIELPCINGLSCWFTIGNIYTPDAAARGYTDGVLNEELARDFATHIISSLTGYSSPLSQGETVLKTASPWGEGVYDFASSVAAKVAALTWAWADTADAMDARYAEVQGIVDAELRSFADDMTTVKDVLAPLATARDALVASITVREDDSTCCRLSFGRGVKFDRGRAAVETAIAALRAELVEGQRCPASLATARESAVVKAAWDLLRACEGDFSSDDVDVGTIDGRDGDDDPVSHSVPVGKAKAEPSFVRFGHMRRLRRALLATARDGGTGAGLTGFAEYTPVTVRSGTGAPASPSGSQATETGND